MTLYICSYIFKNKTLFSDKEKMAVQNDYKTFCHIVLKNKTLFSDKEKKCLYKTITRRLVLVRRGFRFL